MKVFAIGECLIGNRRLVKPQLGRVIAVGNSSIVDVSASDTFLGVPLQSRHRYARVERTDGYDNMRGVAAAGILTILQPNDYPAGQSSLEEFNEMNWQGIQNEARDRAAMLN